MSLSNEAVIAIVGLILVIPSTLVAGWQASKYIKRKRSQTQSGCAYFFAIPNPFLLIIIWQVA